MVLLDVSYHIYMYHRVAAVRISLLTCYYVICYTNQLNHSTQSYFYNKYCHLISLLLSCCNNYLLIAPACLLVNSVPLFWLFHAFYAFLDCSCSRTTVWPGSVSPTLFSQPVYHQNTGRKSWTLGLFFSQNFLSLVFLSDLSAHCYFSCSKTAFQKCLFFPFFLLKYFPVRPGTFFDLKVREDWRLNCNNFNCDPQKHWGLRTEEYQLSDI